MKVLFLDIDGVINTVGAELGFRECYGLEKEDKFISMKNLRARRAEIFDPACLYYLRQIIEETGCKIVVSSTWRNGETVESMKSWFDCPVIKEAIISKTPSYSSLSNPELKDRRGYVQRGEEIKWWIDNHPEVTAWAILDDDSDMDIVRSGFFKTCTYDGLKKDVAQKVIFHLNYKELSSHYRMNIALIEFLAEAKSCLGDIPGYAEYQEYVIKGVNALDEESKRLREIKYGLR